MLLLTMLLTMLLLWTEGAELLVEMQVLWGSIPRGCLPH